MGTPPSDEVAGYAFIKQAQEARLIRFCKEFGFDPEEAMAGKVDLSPILDDMGKIVPEAIDFFGTDRSKGSENGGE